MGSNITLTTPDNFALGAYIAEPSGKPKGAVVVIQEIFGVNSHIREVTDGYAEAGYWAVAPKIFDRVEPDIELGYSETDMGAGIELAFQKLDMQQTLADLQVAVLEAGKHGKVGVVGYCFGGLLTWLSACHLDGVAAASSYYGGGVAGQLDNTPRCPVIFHFGELDAHIPMSDVDAVKTSQPNAQVFVYPADHGFNCDHRASYNAAASKLALQRTLEHFSTYVAA